MNFQAKLLETTTDLRTRAAALANVDALKGSFAALTLAGRELNKVARRHGARLVKENSAIAVEAGRDFSVLARTAYAALTKKPAAARKARQTPAARKRAARKAA